MVSVGEYRGEESMNTSVKRRSLLKASTVAAGGLVGQMGMPAAQQTAGAAAERLTVKEVLAKARERLYPTCRVCPVCNGVACSGDGGGIAGAGSGMSFQNNFTALQRVRLVMRN